MDYHFKVEQEAGSSLCNFFGYNGTYLSLSLPLHCAVTKSQFFMSRCKGLVCTPWVSTTSPSQGGRVTLIRAGLPPLSA
jgi:hypothetical protein